MGLASWVIGIFAKSIVDTKADFDRSFEKHRSAKAAKPKFYPAAIVGESHYQTTIKRLREGERVYLVKEADNPFDASAIAVVDCAEDTIGYLPKDSWARRMLIKEKKGCIARVKSITGTKKQLRGVVLEIAEHPGPGIDTRIYRQDN